VFLAAVAGWVASRQITAPLLALAKVTTHMAGGDLSARADVARDDELGLLARSFNEMAGQVERTVDTLRRFVADAAHALHTPLTALRTNLELTVAHGSVDARGELIAGAQAQVERLEMLANGLLELSRLETVATQQAWTFMNLAGLVRETSELHASRAEQAGIAFSLDLPTEPVIIAGVAVQLRHAISNLMDNAIKFTPEGGEIRVGLRREDEWVRLWVQDTGIGIPIEDMPRLFDRFHRGTNASAYPGNGLGLAIVKAVVTAHDGQVTAQSVEQGSRFTIQLRTG
jgi:two-component system sensor histidine kinase MprB